MQDDEHDDPETARAATRDAVNTALGKRWTDEGADAPVCAECHGTGEQAGPDPFQPACVACNGTGHEAP